MKIWFIWLDDPQEPGPWLHAAMNDEQTALDDRWDNLVKVTEELARNNRWEMRVSHGTVPDAWVTKLFDTNHTPILTEDTP